MYFFHKDFYLLKLFAEQTAIEKKEWNEKRERKNDTNKKRGNTVE